MKSTNDLLNQLIENARNEGRQEIRDAVLAALGADKLWSPAATTGAAKNGRAKRGAARVAIIEALKAKPGASLEEVREATGILGRVLSVTLSNLRRRGVVGHKGQHGSYRYYLKRGA